MSVWLKNLQLTLQDKSVLILHGNVRDRYIDEHRHIYENLTGLITNFASKLVKISTELNFYDPKGGERRTTLKNEYVQEPPINSPALSQATHSASKKTGDLDKTTPLAKSTSGNREDTNPSRTLARWARELKDPTRDRFYVLFYLDKLVSYKTSYSDDERERLIWLEKIIENISSNNRLIIVALKDTMVPIELYTHSPKCRVLPIPMPDKEDRAQYIHTRLNENENENLDLIANLTDGLYLRELDYLIKDIQNSKNLSTREIRRLINRYRVGVQQDYWGNLSLEKLDNAFQWFVKNEGVKGQDQAVYKVIEVLTVARAGLSGMASGTTAKPKGVLFFAGPTGVGKTFLAKKLAKFLFDSEEAFIRFDMSEYKEEHTVSKLIGSPPGFVGFERGGMLTNAVRERPFSVVLFDEIEKAHPKIMDIFLQILDEGRLTDSRGQTVFFTEAVIIFTSNLGCRTTDSLGRPIEENKTLDNILKNQKLSEAQRQQRIQEHFIRSVEQFFMFEISRPELLNRIGSNIVPFNYIHSANVQAEIVSSHLNRIQEEFEDKHKQAGYKLSFSDEVANWLVKKCGRQMEQFGGRGITNSIDEEIIKLLARNVLFTEYHNQRNVQFTIRVQNNQLTVTSNE